MEASMTKNSKLKRKQAAQGKGPSHSPRPRDRDIKRKLTTRLFREGSPVGPIFVDCTFPTQDGGVGQLRVPLSELRHPKRLLDQFYDHMPVFPKSAGETDTGQLAFLKKQVSRRRGLVEVIPNRTGFIDKKSFATWHEVIHSGGRRIPIPRDKGTAADVITDLKGSLKGSTRNVLLLARYSSFLAFSIGVALAAPLQSYLRLNRREGDAQALVLTETAVFNFSGKSSSGKSSSGLAAMSLIGSPERVGTMNFSERGLAECAAESNDIVLVADDTEQSTGDLIKTLRLLTHIVPGGRSKQISKGVDQIKFPELRWTTFVMCSSPRPIPILAAELGWAMSPGDKVRLFDINVPPPEEGGIFDRVPGGPRKRAKRSVQFIAKLEGGYLNHHGHVFPKWIVCLLANNYAPQVVTAANEFVRHVGAENDGWWKRFAQKFGMIYAAMSLGVTIGLLPWPADLPLKVATKCYRRAQKGAMSKAEISRYFAAKLCKRITRPNRLADVSKGTPPKNAITLSSRCVGLRYYKRNRLKIGIFDDALEKRLKTKKAKSMFTTALTQARVIGKGHGHAGTVQVHVPVVRGGDLTRKPHVWEMDFNRLRKFIR
jgi:hypothetical protein